MKYSPGLPQKNVNVSHNNPLTEFGLLCAGLAVIFLAIYWILGLLVDVIADRIPYESEAALFNSISRHLPFTMDTEAQELERIQKLINGLQPCTDLPYSITVHLVDSQEANAVALPGGHIGVFKGLLDAVPSENGLAFVLAHELGHFENRDHLRGLGRSLVLFGISAMFTGGDSSISRLLAPSSILTEAQYSQARESMADRAALDTLNCTYGHVGKAEEFFNYILEQENPFDIKIFHYFSTHPETKKRLQDLQNYAVKMGYPLKSPE